MELMCDTNIAAAYKSGSQQARVISEHWFAQNAYCLACQAKSLQKTVPNTIATDFLCDMCGHKYELKTFRKRPRKTIPDGAYSTFVSRIREGSTPTLCLLERDENWHVRSLTAIHASLITEWAVQCRPRLPPTARRAGWVGCNIRLDRIPPDGEIALIEKGRERPQMEIRKEFQRFLPLSALPADRRGWTTLTLSMVRRFSRSEFTLHDLYARERDFAAVYPNNRHIRAKIRQQLQTLRDLGIVAFLGNGRYSVQP